MLFRNRLANFLRWCREFDRRRYSTDLRYRFRLNRRIVAAGFGLVLNPAPWPDQYNVDSALAVSGAPQRVGWLLKSPEDSRAARAMRNWRGRQYTTIFAPPRSPNSMLRHHEHFIRELGLTSYKPRAPSLVVDPQLAQSVPASPLFCHLSGGRRNSQALAHCQLCSACGRDRISHRHGCGRLRRS